MRPFTEYHGKLFWRNKDGETKMKQILINNIKGIFINAKELAKEKKDVVLLLVTSHYDKNAYNYNNKFEWYDFKDGEFVKDKET